MIKNLTFSLLILALLVACAPAAAPTPMPATAAPTEEPLTQIRLPMGYIPNVQYAPYYVAVDKGYFREEGIEIIFDYSFETDGMALVGANNLPFAVVSGEQVLLARAQGLPVVYVMAWYQKYPVSVASKAGEDIRTAQDLRGKKIGLPGLFGANYIGLRAMLSAAGVDESEVTLESIGFNQVEALVSGQVQAIVGYAANEPVQLRNKGYDLNEQRVAEYAQLAANGIVTNETVIAQNPALVRGFLRALTRGISDTFRNPVEAYNISEKFVENLTEADRFVQYQVLTTSIEMWRAPRIGFSERAAWENMQTVLLAMGMYSSPLDIDRAFTNEFLPAE
jgi:NitT/TauT family transport system substrate-binding protein